ncbi:MAG TPA: hypothetical protein VHT24_10165 [Pseudacidobacterium sp.]|nr:hypothetical protein [Pseudacidobacterium sp.]
MAHSAFNPEQRENLGDVLKKARELERERRLPPSPYLIGAEAVNNVCRENNIPLDAGLDAAIRNNVVHLQNGERSNASCFTREAEVHLDSTKAYAKKGETQKALVSATGVFLNIGGFLAGGNNDYHRMKTGN